MNKAFQLLAVILVACLLMASFSAFAVGDDSNTLKAGAGSAEIIFADAMYPMSEGFVTAHDNPHARVLVVENGEKVAIVSMELVNTPTDAIDIIKQVINEKTGTPLRNIWVQSTHVFCAPHAPDEGDQRAMFLDAVTQAITEAAQEAADSFQEAVFGVGAGESALTSNRDVRTTDGKWVWALNGEGVTDPTLTVLKFDALDGSTIGTAFAYSTRSYCADVSRGTSGREITSDFTGVAAAMLEAEYGAPALFLPTASADQSPIEAAQDVVKDENGYAVAGEDGKTTATDLGVQEGLKIAQRLGTQLGNEVIAVAKTVTAGDGTAKVARGDTSYTWPTTDGGQLEIGMLGVTIGDTALVGIMPEINTVTGLQLRAVSPYGTTLMMSFVNGDQSYMPDAENYELGKPEASRSSLVKGAAEACVDTAAAMLDSMSKGITVSTGTESAGSDHIVKDSNPIQFGGYSWYVLDEQDGRQLIISEHSLTTMGYKADGGATTWETSDVRAWLNAEFYESLPAADQARVVETALVNSGSPQYGTPGGNNTVDRVFLLSSAEAAQYFHDNDDRIATDITTGEATMWLLRTPGKDSQYVCDVNTSGYIDTHGILVIDANSEGANAGGSNIDYASSVNGGIRPALWITKDSPVSGFTDVEAGAWYYKAVDYVVKNGLMSVTEKGAFQPDGMLTRAMLVQTLYNREGNPAVTAAGIFTDVDANAPYADAVIWAAANGIVEGDGNGLFAPEALITREQMVVILYRYAKAETGDAELISFVDAANVSDWARNAVTWAVSEGILTGKDGQRIDPQGQTTRAEAAVILTRYWS